MRVPCLHDGATVVWDSLAIAEYLAERHAGMWPVEPVARAWARSICAEMHSGFPALRNEMAMCIRERVDVRPWSAALERDIARVIEIWNESRRRFGTGRDRIFAAGSRVADAFYAPVAFRFRTYGVDPGGAAGAYLQALLAHPFLRQWEEAALKETAIIDADEPRIIYRDKIAGERRARHRVRASARSEAAPRRGCSSDRRAFDACRRRSARPLRRSRRSSSGAAAPRTSTAKRAVGDVLDTTAYAGIVDYDPTELVITARAGTRLADVGQTLAASGQMLPCEPPAFGAGATLGGAVAAGLSGPRRPYAGAMRDIVLGVRMHRRPRRRTSRSAAGS